MRLVKLFLCIAIPSFNLLLLGSGDTDFAKQERIRIELERFQQEELRNKRIRNKFNEDIRDVMQMLNVEQGISDDDKILYDRMAGTLSAASGSGLRYYLDDKIQKISDGSLRRRKIIDAIARYHIENQIPLGFGYELAAHGFSSGRLTIKKIRRASRPIN